jgi:hypothetical protein
MITCPNCDGHKYIDYICPHCNGTGEGKIEGRSCGFCPRNSGIITEICDQCEGKGKVLAPSFKLTLKNNNILQVSEIDEDEICLSIIDKDGLAYDQITMTIDELLLITKNIKEMRKD